MSIKMHCFLFIGIWESLLVAFPHEWQFGILAFFFFNLKTYAFLSGICFKGEENGKYFYLHLKQVFCFFTDNLFLCLDTRRKIVLLRIKNNHKISYKVSFFTFACDLVKIFLCISDLSWLKIFFFHYFLSIELIFIKLIPSGKS